MTVRGYLRGHPIIWDGDDWVFEDNGEIVEETFEFKVCAKCGLASSPEGHDPCLGTLPGVENACCGHGIREDAYIRFTNGMVVTGFDKVEYNWRPDE